METILLFIGVLILLVLVHEWGHFYAAKKFGIRVDEFGIGFPPKLFGKKVGETEYTLNALPLGGFVKIWGENPEEVAELSEQEKSRSFGAQAKWKQAVVLSAGVAMNVVLAWILYTAGFFIGAPTVVAEDSPMAKNARLTITTVLPESPASEHLLPGDIITNIYVGNATLTQKTPSAVSALTAQGSKETPVNFSISRGEELHTFSIVPQKGLLAEDDARAVTGISTALVTFESHGIRAPISALARVWEDTWMIVTGIGTLIAEAFTGKNELISQMAGPVGIASMVGDAATLGAVWLLMFTGIISLNLAVLNLLPIPALDGGRLVIVGIEAIRKKALSPRVIGIAHSISFLLLLVLLVFVTIQDIDRLFF